MQRQDSQISDHNLLNLNNVNVMNDSVSLRSNPSGTCYSFKSKSKQNFIIYLSCTPKSSSIEYFSQFMKDHGVTDVFCFCTPEYDPLLFSKYNLNFHNLEFPDGSTPTQDLLDRFDQIIDQRIKQTQTNKIIINVHCHTGMGRAPTFIAYLMISRCGIDPYNSIDIIRKQRRGCFNTKQLDWITNTKIKKRSIVTNSCILL
jgi:hypothetical protein